MTTSGKSSGKAVAHRKSTRVKTTLLDLISGLIDRTPDDTALIASIKRIFASSEVRILRSFAPIRLVAHGLAGRPTQSKSVSSTSLSRSFHFRQSCFYGPYPHRPESDPTGATDSLRLGRSPFFSPTHMLDSTHGLFRLRRALLPIGENSEPAGEGCRRGGVSSAFGP